MKDHKTADWDGMIPPQSQLTARERVVVWAFALGAIATFILILFN